MSRQNRHDGKSRSKKKKSVDKKSKSSDEKNSKKSDASNQDAHVQDTYKPENPTKITVRNLPPKLTEAAFVARLKTKNFPDHSYFHYATNDQSLHPWDTCQCYINFLDTASCEEFYRNWDGFDFSIDVVEEEEKPVEDSAKEPENGAEDAIPEEPETPAEPTVDQPLPDKKFIKDGSENAPVDGLTKIEGLDKLLNLKQNQSTKATPESYHCFVEISKFQKIPGNSKINKVGQKSQNLEDIKKELQYSGKIFKAMEYQAFLEKIGGKEKKEVNGTADGDGEKLEGKTGAENVGNAGGKTSTALRLEEMMKKLELRRQEETEVLKKKSNLIIELEKEHQAEKKRKQRQLLNLKEKRQKELEDRDRRRRDQDCKKREERKNKEKKEEKRREERKMRGTEPKEEKVAEKADGETGKKNIRIRKRQQNKASKEREVKKEVKNDRSAATQEALDKLMGEDILRDGKVTKIELTTEEVETQQENIAPPKNMSQKKAEKRARKEKLAKEKDKNRPLDRSERIDRANALRNGEELETRDGNLGEQPVKNDNKSQENSSEPKSEKPKNNRNRDRRNRNRGGNRGGDSGGAERERNQPENQTADDQKRDRGDNQKRDNPNSRDGGAGRDSNREGGGNNKSQNRNRNRNRNRDSNNKPTEKYQDEHDRRY